MNYVNLFRQAPAALKRLEPRLVALVRRVPGRYGLLAGPNRVLISCLGWRLDYWDERAQIVRTRRSGLDSAWFGRLLYFSRLLGRVETVEGAVVECGVAYGASLAMLASLVRASGRDRHLWGFDSWRGLPKPTPEDLSSEQSVASTGLMGEARPADVYANLRGHGFSPEQIRERVSLVPGPLAETLPGYRGGPIALLHVDVDLYQSYREVLCQLWDQIAPGGVVAFDEYLDVDTWPGARLAVDEHLEWHGLDLASIHQDPLFPRCYLVKEV